MISTKGIAQLPDASRSILIRGSIVTNQGKPLPRATVEVRDLHGLKLATSITNGAGNFTLTAVAAPGEYILLAAKETQTRDQRITVDRSELEVRLTLPFASESAGGKSLQMYTVSAEELRISEKARSHLKAAHHEFTKLNLAGAERELDRALQADAAFAEAFAMRALVKLALRDTEGALEDAKRAVSFNPLDVDAYVALATAYNSLKDFQKSEDAAQQALCIQPGNWQGQLEMAKALYGQRRFVPALRELDELSKDFPDVHLVRANVLTCLDRRSEAAAEFHAFLTEAPDDPRSGQVWQIVAQADHATVRSSFSQP